jgi:hypothetical protein
MTTKELDSFLKLLYQDNPAKAKKFVKKYSHAQPDLLTNEVEEFADIAGEYYYELGEILPKGVTLESGEDEDDDNTYWLDFGIPQVVISGGQLVIVNYDYDVITKFTEMAKEAGVKNTALAHDYWAEYS